MSNTVVAILLCTYNGGPYLKAQLDSIANQTHKNWVLWISDDGSVDDTAQIVQQFAQQQNAGQVNFIAGPAQGVVKNFLSLACHGAIAADYYAYCDQDDIWEPDKLTRSLSYVENEEPGTPALYCSRTRYIDDDNGTIGLSPLFKRAPGFRNAIVQNIAGGNTMLFNHAARVLLQHAGADVAVAMHDWWTYMVVSACGGRVHYDAQPSLRYRQHGNNVIGMNTGWAARRDRIGLLWKGRFQGWMSNHLVALDALQDHLTPDSRQVLACLAQGRQAGVMGRVWMLVRSRVYRQTLLGDLGLVAAAALNKI